MVGAPFTYRDHWYNFLGSRTSLAQEMWSPRAELDRYPRAGCSAQCFDRMRGVWPPPGAVAMQKAYE